MDLVRQLNRLGKEVMKTFPRINCGGCCVYASMVSIELRKQGIKTAGIVANWDADSTDLTIDSVRKTVAKNNATEWNHKGIGFWHVGLEFEIKGKLRHYDTFGVHSAKDKFSKIPIYKGRLTHAEMKQLAGSGEGWNRMFDRKQIPALRKMIREYLSAK